MSHFNTCAVCDTAIGHQFLMCPSHWHLVPRQMKSEVYRCWIDLRAVAHLTLGPERQRAQAEYDEMRAAAINAVNERLQAREAYLRQHQAPPERTLPQRTPTTPRKGGHRADHE